MVFSTQTRFFRDIRKQGPPSLNNGFSRNVFFFLLLPLQLLPPCRMSLAEGGLGGLGFSLERCIVPCLAY